MTRRTTKRKTVGKGWFHAVLMFFRNIRDAFRGGATPAAKPRKPAPFCTVCGERTRPWDPADDARHAHDEDEEGTERN